MRRVVVASHFEQSNVERIREWASERAGEDVEVLYEPSLVAPPRWPGDIVGERDWSRSEEGQREFLEMLSGAEVLLDFPRGLDRSLIEAVPRLGWVQGGMAGAGPVAREFGLLETDVTVTTASGVFSAQLAEFVLGGMLHHAKSFERLRRNRLEKAWREGETGTIEGKTLCVIGTGSIGLEISERARRFGMEVIGVKRTVREDDEAHGFTDSLYEIGDLHEALGRSDYVTITLPHTAETEGLVDQKAFEAMRDGVHLSNVGRGAVVDEEALVAALESEKVSGAALDVFATEPLPEESPLWDFENVIISPHSTDNVPEIGEIKLIDLFLENFRRYLAGEPLKNVLDKELLY